MNKRIPAAALALCLLTGCGARAPLELPEAEADSTAVAYIPLDDRPDNVAAQAGIAVADIGDHVQAGAELMAFHHACASFWVACCFFQQE